MIRLPACTTGVNSKSRLAELLTDAQEQDQQHAVCYIDLDQFKVVNDVCGHGAGDELLCQLAGLLQCRSVDADVLARLGGDEFGVLLTHCNIEQAVQCCRKYSFGRA